ncbi:MAG TPA: hypothetical protein VMK66_13910 [Myxococcales bacterium]|nr:hypothetical protein [Myxococcales bacterium]
MTAALRSPLGALFSAFLLASPGAWGKHSRRSPPPSKPDDSGECLRLASPDEVLAETLRSLLLGPEGKGREIGSVVLSGTRTLSDDALWELVGGPPKFPLTREEAIALLARFAQSGLFSLVEPRIRPVPAEETASLEIALTEHPTVRSVQVRGLSEFRTEDIVDRLLEVPADRAIEKRRQEVRNARPRACPAPLPSRAWLARSDDGEVHPGILWQGLRGSLVRVLRYLRSRGYPLARLEGELTPDGQLRIDVDEGHVLGIEVRGVDARLAPDVEKELDIRRGDVFSSGELYNALDRIQRRWPFLKPDRRGRQAPAPPLLRLQQRPDGGVGFHSERKLDARPPPARPADEDDDEEPEEPGSWHKDEDGEDAFAELHDFPDGSRKRKERRLVSRDAWYGFDGETLVVYLRSERSHASAQWVELIRHTPVTGFAPGLAGTLTLYDPADRAHVMFDGAVNFNTRRPNLETSDGSYLERLNAQQRVDWLLGPRIRIPGLAIAELGGQIHNLTDTADRWRISAGDSYLYSALVNRSDREYYRRSGFAAFLTAHLFEELTLGAEYRRDRYAALNVPGGVWSVFNSGDVRYGSAPVDEGEMGSAVFRLEYRSEKVPLHKVGTMWRNPETSLVESEPWAIGLRSVNTFEVADRSLGGIFDFTRLVSDSLLILETGRESTFSLRFRAAGGHDLPQQKQEGLGGWTALRGYDFKEFRGDASLLGTVQLQWKHFGTFLDVGSVRQPGIGWIDPKPSAGAMFCFARRTTCAEAAWRLDDRAKAAPDFRILFSVPL